MFNSGLKSSVRAKYNRIGQRPIENRAFILLSFLNHRALPYADIFRSYRAIYKI